MKDPGLRLRFPTVQAKQKQAQQPNTKKTTKGPNTLGCKSWWVSMLQEKQKAKPKLSPKALTGSMFRSKIQSQHRS